MNGGTEMDVREKLVELIAQKVCGTWSESCDEWLPHDCGKCYANDCHISEIADHLIINGVTVQEWISVDDRMPDACGFPCLLCGENSFGQIRVFEGFTGYMERGKLEWHSNLKDIDIDVWTITHWMPMPSTEGLE